MLTVAQLRAYVTTALEDEPLQGLLTAAYEAINPRLPSGPQTEMFTVDATVLVLSLPASSITSIEDRGVTLEADDYEVISSTMLRRLSTGPNPDRVWRRPRIVYVATASEAERDRMAIALVKLDLNHKPGLTGRRLGEYEESFAANSVFNYQIEREAILSSYNAGDNGGAFV